MVMVGIQVVKLGMVVTEPTKIAVGRAQCRYKYKSGVIFVEVQGKFQSPSMTPTYSRYDDHARKARQLTEHIDKHGAPYYEKVQGMLRAHYQQTQPNILLRAVQDTAQEEAQSVEDN